VLPGTLTLASVNGVTSPTSATGTRFELTLSDGSRWLLYASSALTFEWTRTGMTARTALTGTLRVASLQRTADAALLDAHAEAIPRGGRLEVSLACDVATLRFVYTSTGSGPLLMNALPHHLARLVLPALVPLEYPTLTGLLRGVEGSTWTMTLPLTTMQWGAPRPIHPAFAPAVQAALSSDTATLPTNVAGDPYFGGKQLARLARFALIADELQDSATATRVRERLSALEGAWLAGTNANPLRFDTTWGGVVTTSSLTDPNADFGSGHYNDHQFHWGYHLYAAAVVGRADASFLATHREALLALVRDIANPSATDPHFPRFRAMDFVRGHSWAAGLSEFADGQNQESSSEAINAWYSMHLLGLAMNEPRVSDVGRVLLALELDAARTYYQMPSQSPLFGYPFKANKVVGILFQTRAFFGTFFAAGPQFVYGIQMLPFTPITESYLPRAWVQDAWPDMSAAATAATPEWRGFLQMAHGIVDRPAAWTEVNALSAFDDGNSRTNALWWVATRPP
jgi:endo-1,3(4)-beta-glucanase